MDPRRHSRVRFVEAVVLVVDDERPYIGTCHDISIGGMFIATDAALAFGRSVIVHLHIPGELEAMALPGVVRWVNPTGVGIQFGLLGAKDTHAITELVSGHQSADRVA